MKSKTIYEVYRFDTLICRIARNDVELKKFIHLNVPPTWDFVTNDKISMDIPAEFPISVMKSIAERQNYRFV